MRDIPRIDSGDFDGFAAAVAHEIRTPLSALAGEVEVALRRNRTAAEYREALERIAAAVTELVEISGDLTLLGDSRGHAGTKSLPANLDAILSPVRSRYDGRHEVTIDAVAAGVRVAGHQGRLGRAVVLVVDHAVRYRQGNAVVRLRIDTASDVRVRLTAEAPPFGFWPRAWQSLSETPGSAAGPLRLRTALRILEGCGGALVPDGTSGMERVHIELPRST